MKARGAVVAALCAFGGVSIGAVAIARRASAAPAADGGEPLSWERAFAAATPERDVHLTARFTGSDGKEHRLEVWRHGDTFLRRRTDEALDLYVVAHRGTPGESDLRFFDHRRHVVTTVRRSNLYRIGVFSDWYGLAHLLERPRGQFEVRVGATPPGRERRDCVWRELIAAASADLSATRARICWSQRWAVPLLIERLSPDRAWVVQLAVDTVEGARLSSRDLVVPPPPPRYGVVDANGEIDPRVED